MLTTDLILLSPKKEKLKLAFWVGLQIDVMFFLFHALVILFFNL